MVAHTNLRVAARPGVLFVRNPSGPRPDYVGRTFDASGVGKGIDQEHPITGPEELPYSARVRAAVASGDLVAADAETARTCGVLFNPPAATGRAPRNKE